MDNVELLQHIMRDLNTLTLTGVAQWETGIRMATGLISVKQNLEGRNQEGDNHEKDHSQRQDGV